MSYHIIYYIILYVFFIIYLIIMLHSAYEHRRMLSAAELFHTILAFRYAESMYIRLLWCGLPCYWAIWGYDILPIAIFEDTRFCSRQKHRNRT